MHGRAVVFVLGSGHCGSTLLDLILGSHSDAFSLAEFIHISQLIDTPDAERGPICAICEGSCAFWDETVSRDALAALYSHKNLYRSLRRRATRWVRNPYGPLFEWTGKPILIDSSKSANWFDRQMSPAYLWRDVEPHLIHLVRDGRAVVHSYLRKYPQRGIEAMTKNWKQGTLSMNKYFDAFPHAKIRIRYEDLSREPEATARALCEWLEVPFEPGMLTYWNHDHHPVAGNAGTYSLVLKQHEQFGRSSADFRIAVNAGNRYYARDYYETLGLAIKPDTRWKQEMSAADAAVFNRIAGDLNGSLADDAAD